MAGQPVDQEARSLEDQPEPLPVPIGEHLNQALQRISRNLLGRNTPSRSTSSRKVANGQHDTAPNRTAHATPGNGTVSTAQPANRTAEVITGNGTVSTARPRAAAWDGTISNGQPPMADIGRAGCRKAGSSIPCPARFPHIATRQASAISASGAPSRSNFRRSLSSVANRQLRT